MQIRCVWEFTRMRPSLTNAILRTRQQIRCFECGCVRRHPLQTAESYAAVEVILRSKNCHQHRWSRQNNTKCKWRGGSLGHGAIIWRWRTKQGHHWRAYTWGNSLWLSGIYCAKICWMSIMEQECMDPTWENFRWKFSFLRNSRSLPNFWISKAIQWFLSKISRKSTFE